MFTLYNKRLSKLVIIILEEMFLNKYFLKTDYYNRQLHTSLGKELAGGPGLESDYKWS